MGVFFVEDAGAEDGLVQGGLVKESLKGVGVIGGRNGSEGSEKL